MNVYYLAIVLSAFLFSLQFLFSDGYQRESGCGWNSALKYSLYSSAAGLSALFAINGFSLRVSAFSLAVAAVYSAVCIALNYFSVKALSIANLSVYSVFSMIGGMLLPFLYGIACGEELRATRIICCILITAAVLMNVGKGKGSGNAFMCYMAVFILNGSVGVISKFHQSYREYCVESADFLMLSKIITAIFCIFFILLGEKRDFSVSKKAFAYSAGGAVLNSIGNLILLIALQRLPASVQYPLLTGGVIVFSTAVELVRKSKLTKKEIAAAFIAFAATAAMAI